MLTLPMLNYPYIPQWHTGIKENLDHYGVKLIVGRAWFSSSLPIAATYIVAISHLCL